MHNAYVSRVAMMDIFSCSTQSSCVKLHRQKCNSLQYFVCTPETRFSEPRFSEILNLMVKLPFSYFTFYPESI